MTEVKVDVPEREEFQALVDVVAALRDPETGCPWDKEQTHQSLKQYIIEEAYELSDAIDSGDVNKISEELGDVLLQVMLHSQVASETDSFDVFDVVSNLRKKLIHRHPHVFGDVKAETSEDVIGVWQDIKKKEQGILAGLPRALPALLRLSKIYDRTKKTNHAPDDSNYSTLKDLSFDSTPRRETLKAALFQLALFCKKNKFNPEELLQEACNEFTDEFEKQEK